MVLNLWTSRSIGNLYRNEWGDVTETAVTSRVSVQGRYANDRAQCTVATGWGGEGRDIARKEEGTIVVHNKQK